MINRELKEVKLLTYTTTKDIYGQEKTTTPSETSIEMVLKLYAQNETNNIIYNNVEVIGLTKYTQITDANRIKDGEVVYDILHIIPSNRYYQVLMRVHK